MPACLIDACKRTTTRWPSDVAWVCHEHWRHFCPPGSKERRCYLRFHRIGRRYGWNHRLRLRYWRFWRSLEKRMQRRARGDLDIAEINRAMGW